MIKMFLGSMASRIFLILLAGTILTGILMMTLAEYERKDMASQMRARHAAERVVQLIQTLEAVPATSRSVIAGINEKSGIRIDFTQSTALVGNPPITEFASSISQLVGDSRAVSAYERVADDCPVRDDGFRPPHAVRRCQTVLTTLKDGTPVRFDMASREGPPPPSKEMSLVNFLAFLLGISAIALFVAYIATKPLRKLAQAARDFGHHIEPKALPENAGPNEVREASQAFNRMQSSIRHHIQERTYMLAAIAHDLQTPLTRLRLRLEKVQDDALRAQLVTDLTATQAMVREGLDFAQEMSSEEPFELVDMESLVEAVCNDYTDAGSEVTFSGGSSGPIMVCPHALRRCIGNLLDNAIKYGKFAHVSVKRDHSKVIVTVTDGGPGIPEDQLETVFQPFKRLEDSRSRGSGGTGLGLTIARIIAGRHGGNLKLKNMAADDLGLMAILELPIR
jgi:signal transduction histidine kinase